MSEWRVTDGQTTDIIEADTAEEAAREYVEAGEYGQTPMSSGDPVETVHVPVHVQPASADETDTLSCERVLVTIEPDEPACSDERGHDWRDGEPWGHGGGVIVTDRCARCGLRRKTDTWDQASDGEQGLTTVRYERGEEE